MSAIFRNPLHAGGGYIFNPQAGQAGATHAITPNVTTIVVPSGATMLWGGAMVHNGFVVTTVTPAAALAFTPVDRIDGATTLVIAIQAAMTQFNGHGIVGQSTLHVFPFGAQLIYDGSSFPRWPSALPTGFLKDGFTLSPQDSRLRSPMDAGRPKQRRRFTAKTENFTGPLLMDPDQVTAFVEFYDDVLQDGTLTFRWVHPRTRLPVDMQFVGPYSLTSFDGRNYFVNVSVEVLP